MKLPGLFCFLAIFFVGVVTDFAQSPSASPSQGSLIPGGDFERGVSAPTLWDGVDLGGYLAGMRDTANVLGLAGTIVDSPMPVSVSVGDLNGDGLPDLLTTDPQGYVRIYFNHGTKEEPKFTYGEMSLPFLVGDPNRYNRVGLRIPRGTLVDLGDGKLDLIVGNYRGDILRIHNGGTIKAPAFQQPTDFAKVTIPTIKDPLHRWGNVFSPAMYDWDRDGKLDLLLGEGSYSANNVHLLINQGSSANPRYNEDKHYFAAYGDGREQLNIAVVDYNGDGKPDLLVSDRSGKIGVYLNHSGNTWKQDDELSLDSFIQVNGVPLTFRDICCLAVGDLNGDGLFDIIVGKTNGRIAYVKNIGTKGAPKFDVPVELQGSAFYPKIKSPSAALWDINTGQDRGNFYGIAEIVSSDQDKNLLPPQGTSALRLGYVIPPTGTTVASPHIVYPSEQGFNFSNYKTRFDWRYREGMAYMVSAAASNIFGIQNANTVHLKVGATYTLSFKTKGSGVKNALARVIYMGLTKADASKITRGERGAVIKGGEISESNGEALTFSPTKAWSEIKLEVTVKFKEKELRDLKTTEYGDVQLYFELDNGTGEVYLDDLKLVEKAK